MLPLYLVLGILMSILFLAVFYKKPRYPVAMWFEGPKKRQRKRKASVSGFAKSFIQQARAVGWNITEYEYWGIVLMGIIAGSAFGMIMRNEIIVVIGVAAGFMLPKIALSLMRSKRYEEISGQLETAFSIIASSFGIYPNFLDAIRNSIDMMQPPIKDEFITVVREVESGVPLEEALANMEERVPFKELKTFNQVAVVAQNSGGKAKEVLQQCAKLVAENRILKKDLESELAQARQEAVMLFCLLIGGILFFRFFQGDFFDFYYTPLGKGVMTVVFLAGSAIAYRLYQLTKMEI